MTKNNQNLIDAVHHAVDHAKKIGAQYAEARIIKTHAMECEVEKQKLENLSHEKNTTLVIRLFHNNACAAFSTEDLSQNAIRNATQNALDIAKYSPHDKDVRPAEKNEIIKKIPKLNLYDETVPSQKICTEIAKKTENAAHNTKGITNVTDTNAGYTHSQFIFLSTHGDMLGYQKSRFHIHCNAIAGHGTNMESDYDYDQKIVFNELKNPEIIGENAAQRAIKNLNPKKIQSDTMPVIFDPRIATQFISILTQALSGNNIIHNTSFLKDQINHTIAHKNITLIDQPTKIKGLRSKPFDAEGLKTKKTTLIKNGKLKTYLLDIKTAQKLKTQSNAYAAGTVTIQPQPTNTYIEAGNTPPQDMIRQSKKALYITALLGSGANITTGNYSCGAKGFLIQNGEITYPVSEITIAGDLKNIIKMMIPANDLTTDKAFNAPTLYIEKMTVAGR